MGSRGSGPSNQTLRVLQVLEMIGDWLVTGGIIVAALVLVYIGYGLFSGQLYQLQGEHIARVTTAVDTATTLMMVAVFLATLVLVLRTKESVLDLYGYITLVALLFWFGFPALVGYLGDTRQGDNQPIEPALRNFALAGQLMLSTLIIPLVQWVVRAGRERPLQKRETAGGVQLRREAPKHAKPHAKPNVLSPCWHLPYCRDYLLSVCPAFKARRRCWKFGRGCFCDPTMIDSLMSGMRGAKTRNQAAYLQSEIDARSGVLAQRLKKPPCKRCMIYLEHQRLKYEVMHPLVYPLVAALVYFAYEPIIKPLWMDIQTWLINLWQSFAFTEVNVTAEELARQSGGEAVAYMVAGVLGMLVLLGLLRLVEVICFKWKL